MISTTATATEMQNNFGKYLSLVMEGKEIIVTRNGKEVGRFVPKDAVVTYLTDSLTGIIGENHSDTVIREEELKGKYGITD